MKKKSSSKKIHLATLNVWFCFDTPQKCSSEVCTLHLVKSCGAYRKGLKYLKQELNYATIKPSIKWIKSQRGRFVVSELYQKSNACVRLYFMLIRICTLLHKEKYCRSKDRRPQKVLQQKTVRNKWHNLSAAPNTWTDAATIHLSDYVIMFLVQTSVKIYESCKTSKQ